MAVVELGLTTVVGFFVLVHLITETAFVRHWGVILTTLFYLMILFNVLPPLLRVLLDRGTVRPLRMFVNLYSTLVVLAVYLLGRPYWSAAGDWFPVGGDLVAGVAEMLGSLLMLLFILFFGLTGMYDAVLIAKTDHEPNIANGHVG